MKFTPTWRTNDVADIPSFKELEDITGMAYDENGVYAGPKEKPDMQLVIDQRTNRQYWAPKEYDEDAIRYGMAKLDKDFNSKEWWGMVQNPDLSFTEKISTAYIEGLKQAGKLVANAPTKIAGAIAGATDAVGLDAGAAVMASLKTNPIFLGSNVARKGIKATAEDYVQLFKDLKTPKGKMGTTASYWRATANNWEATVNKYLPDVDENVKAHSTLVAIGGLAGQVGGSLLIAAATNGVGGLPAVAAVFGGQQFYDIREEYLQKGYDLDAANIFAGFAALAEGGLEAVGFGHLLKYGTLSRSFRNTLIGGLIESVQEMSQTSAEELITNLSGVREETIAQILTQIAISGVAGFIPGMGFSLMVGGENIAQEKAAYELDRAVEQQQQKALPVKEGQTLPGTTPKQELELAKANKGSNPVYETVKNIANAHGVTDEKAIDAFYYFARNQALQGKLGEQLLEGLGKQIVAYKNQLIGMDKQADQDNKKAAEAIKQHLSAENAQEYHDANVKAMEESGIEKNRAEVAAAQLDILMKNLSEKLGLDLQKFKKVVVRAIPRVKTAQAKQEEAPAMQDYSGEIPFQDRQGGSEADNEIKTLQRQINELDKMARSKPKTTLLSTLRKTGVDYSNTRLDPQVLKDLKIKNVPVEKGGLGAESLEYLIRHGFMQDYSQGEQVSYEMAREKEGEAEEMLERAVSGEDVYRMDDMEKIRNAEQAEAYKQKLQAELDEKIDQEGKRGYIKIGDMINEIVLGRNSDVTTLQHEMIHHFRNLINLLAAQGNKNAIALKEQMDSIIEKHKDEVRQKINSEEEVLSEAYEAWLYGGVVAENQAQQKLFDALKQFFREVYDSVKAITGIRIDPEIDMFFRQLTGQMDIQQRAAEGQTMFQEGIKYDKNGKADINSQEFKKWFGNSKVVDEKGKPLVVYHGTTARNIESFDDVGQFYFSEFKDIAETYGLGDYDYVAGEAREPAIYPVYLNIRNPLNIRSLESMKEVLDEINVKKDSAYKMMERILGGLKFSDLDYNEQRRYVSMENLENQTYTALYLTYQQELIKYAKEKGYDGIFDLEQGGQGGWSYNGFIAFSPTQIKSVYNKGTFDENNPNIYYQFGGQKAKTADPLKLNEAEKMLAAGESSDTIWEKTGWFKGPDGKWRFEINDKDAKLKLDIKPFSGEDIYDLKTSRNNLNATDKNGGFLYHPYGKEAEGFRKKYDSIMEAHGVGQSSYLLGEVFSHDKLFSAYPFLKDIYVRFEVNLGAAAMYDNGVISIGVDQNDTPQRIRTALLHEIQHAIQEHEGFARGGNVNEYEVYDTKIDELEEERVKLAAEIQDMEENGGEARYGSKLSNAWNRILQIRREQDKRRENSDLESFRRYKSLYGEIEARNVEYRDRLEDWDKALSSPEATQDIKSAKAIIVFNDGTELAYTPKENVFYQGERDLYATHNMNLAGAKQALKLGGLAMPSMALRRLSAGNVNDFGEVSFVAIDKMVKPSRGTEVYDRDAWTPSIWNNIKYSLSKNAKKKIESILKKSGEEKKLSMYVYNIENELYDSTRNELALDLYMKEKGLPEESDRWEIHTSPEYIKWYNDNLFDDATPYLYTENDDYTDMVNRKMSLNNIMKILRRKERAAGGYIGDHLFSVSELVKFFPQKFRNMDEIRAKKGNLTGREEIRKKIDELDDAFDSLVKDMRTEGKEKEYGADKHAVGVAVVNFDNKENQLYFLKSAGLRTDDKAISEINKFADRLKNEIPVDYFEVKPRRVVGFSEFAGVIMPNTEEYDSLAKQLDEEYFLPVLRIEKGNVEQYKQALSELQQMYPNVYFQDKEQAYRDDRAQRTGAKAADPKPSKERIAKDIEVIRNNGVEKYQKKSHIIGDIGDLAKYTLLSIRQRAGAIDNKLKAFFDKLDYFQPNLEKKFASKANGFVKKYQTLTEEEKNEFDYYVYNQCFEELQTFLKEKGMANEYQEVRQLLNFIYAISNQAGIDMGFIEEYFPTSMIDYAGFLDHMKGTDKWSYIAKALREADPEGVWSDKEKADAINKLLRGYRLDPVSKPKNANERSIFYKSPELMKFYEHSDVALIKYLQGMSQALAINKAFGKGKGFNTDETIGAIVLDLINSGTITNKEEAEVKKLLKSRLSYGATPQLLAMIRNVGYLQTMNNITNAITQLGDLYAPFYKYSFGTAIEAIFGKSEITKADLGLDTIWEEFSNQGQKGIVKASGIAVDKLFKAIGLENMDSFGKNVSINASLINLRKQAASGDLALTERLAYTFGKDAGKVLADIKEGKVTDDIKILIWADLADTQPIGRSGVPAAYLENPRMRLFYQLKTFMLNQISLFYADSLVNIRKGIKYHNKEQLLKGIGNSFKLVLLLTAGNAGADVLKNLIMGRDIDITDTVVSNLLWNIGVSKYVFYKGKREGYAWTLFTSYAVPPQISIGDDIYKDLSAISQGKRAKRDSQLWTYIPFGRAYYWWFGGGSKAGKARTEKMKKKVAAKNRRKKKK